jgi:hypothetical protein
MKRFTDATMRSRLAEHEPWIAGVRQPFAEVAFRLDRRCIDATEVLPGDRL